VLLIEKQKPSFLATLGIACVFGAILDRYSIGSGDLINEGWVSQGR